MMRMLSGVVLAAVLVLPACSQPTDQAPAGGAPVPAAGAALLDACPLLAADDIATVFGQPPGAPERITGKFAATCKWPSADGKNPELVHVLVTTGSAVSSFEDYERRGRAAMQGRFANTPIQKVEGLGDFAVWAGDDQSGALQVFRGGRLVQVTVSRTGERPALDVARALVARVKPDA